MLRTPPNPFDPARAARIHEFLAEQGFHATGPLLDAVFGNSPFLGRLSVREHGALTEYLAAGPLTVLNAAIQLAHAAARAQSEAEAMTQLRVARRRAALATAMADIGGLWDVNRVTGELTRFADACVGSALRFMLRQAATNQPAAAQSEVTEDDCGLTILAMGKYGEAQSRGESILKGTISVADRPSRKGAMTRSEPFPRHAECLIASQPVWNYSSMPKA